MPTNTVMRQLTIKAFHISSVTDGSAFSITPAGHCTQSMNGDSHNLYELMLPLSYRPSHSPLISNIDIRIISPDEHHQYIESVMDIIPVSTKVLGSIGNGITHTLTGVYVVLTGVDEEGTPVCAFGNSNGYMDEQITFNRPGTPSEEDIIILFQVTLKAKAGFARSGPCAAHEACDEFCNNIRQELKKLKGSFCTESHKYQDIIRPGKPKVALVKLVSGQGAMYDTHFLGSEPSSYIGSRSVMDAPGAPIMLSPNEYRDGAICAMY